MSSRHHAKSTLLFIKTHTPVSGFRETDSNMSALLSNHSRVNQKEGVVIFRSHTSFFFVISFVRRERIPRRPSLSGMIAARAHIKKLSRRAIKII
jgi:hypothetical protein